MTSSSCEQDRRLTPGSAGFQTHLERRFAPGRLEGTGRTAGLEIWAVKNGLRMLVATLRGRVRRAATKNKFVHRVPGPFYLETRHIRGSFAQQGRFPTRPCSPCFILCALLRVDTHGQGLIQSVAELAWPTVYPPPSSRVTTTLNASRLGDSLTSGNVRILITA